MLIQPGYFIASFAAVLLYGLSALGWGAMTARFCYGGQVYGWAFTTALGLGTWIFIGGVLNFLRLSGPSAIDILLVVGVIASLAFLGPAFQRLRGAITLDGSTFFSRCAATLPYTIMLAAVVFLISTVMPTFVLNWDDDLRTYLVRPVRMLQTGTVAGDPFDTLGIDSLGAQSFLHAPFMAHLGPAFSNGVDAILCFALAGCLLIELAHRLGTTWPITTLAVCAFVAIHPQIVNISAVYSGSLMTLLIVSASLLLLDSALPALRLIIPPALATASMMALKGTFVSFVLMYWTLFFVTLWLTQRGPKRTLVTAGILGLSAAVFVLPWVAVYLPLYLGALAESPGADRIRLFADADGIGALFSARALFWGGNLLAYDVVALLMAIVFGWALWTTCHRPAGETGSAIVLMAALAGATVGTFLLNADIFDVQTAVRYSAPLLIAALPAALLLLGGMGQGSNQRVALGTAIVAALAIVIVLFSVPLMQRVEVAVRERTLLSYPVSASAGEYIARALGAPARRWAREAQMSTEEGSTILAWTSVPFQFDFRRNRILSVREPGLVNPWLRLPISDVPQAWREYLRAQGVRYVFLQYGGFRMNTEGMLEMKAASRHWLRGTIAAQHFRKSLLALSVQSRPVWSAPQAVLYEL